MTSLPNAEQHQNAETKTLNAFPRVLAELRSSLDEVADSYGAAYLSGQDVNYQLQRRAVLAALERWPEVREMVEGIFPASLRAVAGICDGQTWWTDHGQQAAIRFEVDLIAGSTAQEPDAFVPDDRRLGPPVPPAPAGSRDARSPGNGHAPAPSGGKKPSAATVRRIAKAKRARIMRGNNEQISAIARKLGVCERTVNNYLTDPR